MKKTAIVSVALVFCLALSFFGGNLVTAFASDGSELLAGQEFTETNDEVDAESAQNDELEAGEAEGLPAEVEAQDGEAATTTRGSISSSSIKPMSLWGISAVNKGTYVEISWPDFPGATGYDVFRGTDPDGRFERLVPRATTSPYKDDNEVMEGDVYFYYVAAKSGETTLDTSEIIECVPDVTAPGMPENLRIDGTTSNSITVVWEAPLTGSPVDAYEVWVSDSESDGYTLLEETSSLTITQTGLAQGVTKYYKVKAKNSAGESGFAGPKAGTTGINAPADVSGAEGNATGPNEIVVTWDPPVKTGDEGDVDEYIIYHRDSETGTWTEVGRVDKDDENKFVHDKLEPGSDNYYKVVTSNKGGDSEGVETGKVVTPFEVVGEPKNLKVVAQDSSTIIMTWDKADTDPKNVDKYVIIGVNPATGNKEVLAEIPSIHPASGNVIAHFTFVYEELDANTVYELSVHATNNDGIEGPAINGSDKTFPGVVGGLTGKNDGPNKIIVTWDAVPGDDIEYIVEYSDTEGGPYQQTVVKNPSFEHDGLDPESDYYYRVTVKNSTGEGDPSDELTVSTAVGKPGAIEGLQAKPDGTDSIVVSWNKPTDGGEPDGYYVYVSKTGKDDDFELIPGGVVTGTEVTVDGLDEDTEYYFRVQSKNASGDGPLSEIVNAVTDKRAPGKIDDLAATPNDDTKSVTLTWSEPNGGSVDEYIVYRADKEGGPYKEVGRVKGTDPLTTVDKDLSPDSEYFYKVKAVNRGGESESNIADVRTKLDKPGSVLDFNAEGVSTSEVKVSWKAPTDGGTPSEYVVYISKNGTDFEPVTKDPITGTEIVVGGLEADTTYYFKMQAKNKTGEGPMTDVKEATTKLDKPGVVSGLQGEALDTTTIVLDWKAPVDGGKVEKYIIYRSTTDGGYTEVGTANGTEFTYTDKDLKPNTEYFYKVKAVNKAGEGELSPYVAVKTKLEVPGMPQTFRANRLEDNTEALLLTWETPITGGEVDKYELFFTDRLSGPYTSLGEVGSDVFEALIEDLVPGRLYLFKMVAKNDAGESLPAGPINSHPTPVYVPEELAAIGYDTTSIMVSWKTSQYADTYRVYRSTSEKGAYSLVAVIDDNTIGEYLDTGLKSSTTYYYRVTSTRGQYEGQYAGPVAADTMTPLSAPLNVEAQGLTSSTIRVRWTAVDSAARYKIYRGSSESGPFQPIDETADLEFIDTGLKANTTYYYVVTSVNNLVGESVQSAPAKATTLTDLPGKPFNVKATGTGQMTMRVDWTPVSGAIQYYIYRSNTQYGTYSPVGQSSTNSFNDSGLWHSTSYWYVVKAVNKAGEGLASDPAKGTTFGGLAGIPPCCVDADDVGTSQIFIKWKQCRKDKGINYGYRVYRSLSKEGGYELVGDTPNLYFLDTGLKQDTKYYYKIESYSQIHAAMSKYESETTHTLHSPDTLSLSLKDKYNVLVNWDQCHGEDVVSKVYRSTSPNGGFELIHTGMSTDSKWVDSGLKSRTTYYYYVENIGGGATLTSKVKSITTK